MATRKKCKYEWIKRIFSKGHDLTDVCEDYIQQIFDQVNKDLENVLVIKHYIKSAIQHRCNWLANSGYNIVV